MWQAATLGGPKPYSSASSLPGFYSTGYPPTPPKDSQTDEPPAPPRAAAGNSEEYINSSLSSSISSEDLMSNDMKPTPESLMGFHSFPYSSRKIQEGIVNWLVLPFFLIFIFILFYFVPPSLECKPVSSELCQWYLRWRRRPPSPGADHLPPLPCLLLRQSRDLLPPQHLPLRPHSSRGIPFQRSEQSQTEDEGQVQCW